MVQPLHYLVEVVCMSTVVATTAEIIVVAVVARVAIVID